MTINDTRVATAIQRMSLWLDAMRSDQGYGGPVTHWWESCWLYAGPMIDWRYEGILCGYTQLFERTQHPYWLERAVTAGEDACNSQLPDGRFRNSSFQQGPIEGGTPHEAAVDIGLLVLARALLTVGDSRWTQFFEAAQKNLLEHQIGRLWKGEGFRDQDWNQTCVPNKNATTIEALILYETLSGEAMDAYIKPAADVILNAQVTDPGPRQGATVHLGTGRHRLAIGIYTARCVPALLHVYERTQETHYLKRAQAMGQFLLRLLTPEGTLFGYYADGRPITCPTWISPSGDVLRALRLLQPYGDIPPQAIEQLGAVLLNAQMPSGGMPTAYGLGRKGQSRPYRHAPDFRDLVPVVGWCDKTFRALVEITPNVPPPEAQTVTGRTQLACRWKGRDCLYSEDETRITLQQGKTTLYTWNKGQSYSTEMAL